VNKPHPPGLCHPTQPRSGLRPSAFGRGTGLAGSDAAALAAGTQPSSWGSVCSQINGVASPGSSLQIRPAPAWPGSPKAWVAEPSWVPSSHRKTRKTDGDAQSPAEHGRGLQIAPQAAVSALSCGSAQGRWHTGGRASQPPAPCAQALSSACPKKPQWGGKSQGGAGSGDSGAQWEGLFLEASPQAPEHRPWL